MPDLNKSLNALIAEDRYPSKNKKRRSRSRSWSRGRKRRSRSRSREKRSSPTKRTKRRRERSASASKSAKKNRERSASPGEKALQAKLEARRKKFASGSGPSTKKSPKPGEKGYVKKGEKAPKKSSPIKKENKPTNPISKLNQFLKTKASPKDDDTWESGDEGTTTKPKPTKVSSPIPPKPPIAIKPALPRIKPPLNIKAPLPPVKLNTSPAVKSNPPPKPKSTAGSANNPIEVSDEVPKLNGVAKPPGGKLTMLEKIVEYGLDESGNTSEKMKRIAGFEGDKYDRPDTSKMTVKELKKWITDRGGNIKSCPDKKNCCTLALKMYEANQEFHLKQQSEEDKFDVTDIWTIDIDKLVTTKIKALIVNLGGDPSICFLKSDYANLAKELVQKKKKEIDPEVLFKKLKVLDTAVLMSEYKSEEFGWDTEAILDDIKLSKDRVEQMKKGALEKKKRAAEAFKKRKAASQLTSGVSKRQKLVKKEKKVVVEVPHPVYPIVAEAGTVHLTFKLFKDARGLFGIKDLSEVAEGITEATPEGDSKGVYVDRVVGMALHGGIFHKDKLIAVNGKKVDSKDHAMKLLKVKAHFANILVQRRDFMQVFECVQSNVAYRNTKNVTDRVENIKPVKRNEKVEVLDWEEHWALASNGYWLPTYHNNQNLMKQLHHTTVTVTWDMATSLGVKVKWLSNKEPTVVDVLNPNGLLAKKVKKGDTLAFLGRHSLQAVLESKFKKLMNLYKDDPTTNFDPKTKRARIQLPLRIRRKFSTTANGTVKTKKDGAFMQIALKT